jgi:RNA recognition motif-containing protein
MSFLSRLFGLSNKKDSFKNQEPSDLHEEAETAAVKDKVATPSPKAALLRTAGKHAVASDDAHDDKNQIEITVEERAAQPAAASISKVETALPAASTTEGSSIPNIDSEPSTGLPEPGVDESKNTLVIKNLPFKFTKPELDQLLITHQAKAKNVRMLRDGSGRFTGIAFIRCPSKEEAGRLITGMNNLDIAGRGIQVEFKKKKKKTKKPEPGMAPSATTMPPMTVMPQQGYPAMMVYPPVTQFQPYAMSQDSKRAYLTASAPALRTSGLRTSGGGYLVSSTSSVEDEEYLSHIPYNQRRRMSLNSSTSSVDDEDYIPRSLHTSVDDVNQPYPHSRLSLSSSGGISNPKFAMPSVRPVRQPRGPDQTNGFSGEYRKSRNSVATQ